MARPGAALVGAMNKSKEKPIRIKPSRVGSLHTALGVPQGQKIPPGKIASAANSSDANLKKKAVFAKNAAGWG